MGIAPMEDGTMGMFTDLRNCPFCDQPVKDHRPELQPQVHHVECAGCTRYVINFEAIGELQDHPFDQRQKANASGWLREHPGTDIQVPQIHMLRDLDTPIPVDRAVKLFEHFVTIHPDQSQWIEVRFDDPVFRSVGWAQSADELEFLLSSYLVAQLGLFDKREDEGDETFMLFRISPRGQQALVQRKKLPPPQAPPRYPS